LVAVASGDLGQTTPSRLFRRGKDFPARFSRYRGELRLLAQRRINGRDDSSSSPFKNFSWNILRQRSRRYLIFIRLQWTWQSKKKKKEKEKKNWGFKVAHAFD
jgi:hypothetical protein